MVRPNHPRPRRYKLYYENDSNVPIPESTLRYRKRRRLNPISSDNENDDNNCERRPIEGDIANVPNQGFIVTELDTGNETDGTQDLNQIDSDADGSIHSLRNGANEQEIGHEASDAEDIIQTYSVEDNREETTINFPANNSENEQEFQCETNDFEESDAFSEADDNRSPGEEESELDSESDLDDSQRSDALSEADGGGSPGEEESELDSETDLDDSQGSDTVTQAGETPGPTEIEHDPGSDLDDAQNASEASDHQNHQIDPFKRLKHMLNGKFGEELTLQVKISVGEILTNALTLVHKHHMSHLAKENLMKFVNSILANGKIVPSTRFLLDEYFFSKTCMRYFFYCSECCTLLGSAPASSDRPTQIKCPNSKCNHVNQLSDLSTASYFVIFDLISQIELLLGNTSIRIKLVNPIDFVDEPIDGIMRDMYHGSSYRSFARYVKSNDFGNTKVVSLTVSVDSASLCHFSGQSITPVFIMVNELPTVIRMSNLLIAGLWFGVRKAKVDLLLPPIVDHITQLSKGFTINVEEVWNMKAFLIACVADSVGRYEIQGVHSHRGEFSCNWCLHEGEEWGNARIFRYMAPAPPLRTIQELLEDSIEALRTKKIVNGVKYLCLLSPAPLFHPVEGFVVDQMHAKDEGTTKSFLKAWCGEDGETPYYIGQPANMDKLRKRVAQVRAPKELRKSLRDLSHLPYFTGRELENFALFFSIPLLMEILPVRFLMHWALYVQVNYVLLLSELPVAALDIVESLAGEFCQKTETLYGLHMMRFNLHLFLHFVANCRRHGPIFALSAYAFETGNNRMKKLIHHANYVPNQICRGLSEEQALTILKRHFSQSAKTRMFEDSIDRKQHSSRVKLVGKVELEGYSRPFRASEEEEWLLDQIGTNSSEYSQYELLKKDGCYYGPAKRSRRSKTNNSFARLIDGTIIEIKKILHKKISDEILVVGSRVRCRPSRYCPQAIVRLDPKLCFQYEVISIDEDVQIHDVSQLKMICVPLEFDQCFFISPMPNICNMF